MELQQFIKSILTQITQGVAEAQDDLQKNSESEANPYEKKAMICPASGMGQLLPNQPIEFDVAVTAESSGQAGGGIQVFGFGAKGAVTESSVTVSRIKFKVPVRLPSIRG